MHNSNYPRRARAAFTLVELLVVIGIIALLIGILLPSLNKAREASYKVKCLSNLHQIGLAMVMYCNANKGFFPSAASNGGVKGQFAEDFVWWQGSGLSNPKTAWNAYDPTQANTRPNQPITMTMSKYADQGALVRYMGNKFNAAAWTCPSDPVQAHKVGGQGSYPYSYTMNTYLSCENNNPVTTGSLGTYQYRYMKRLAKYSNIRHAADVVMMLEESEASVNDGGSYLTDGSNNGAQGAVAVPNSPFGYIAPGGTNPSLSGDSTQGDWLAVRHDATRRNPDNKYVAGKDFPAGIPCAGAKGCVNFCDGHADFVTRAFAQGVETHHWDPIW